MATDDLTLEALAPLLAPGARLLGLDLGTKTIGIALSDEGRAFASPLKTIKRGKFREDAVELLTICAESAVGALILGMPLNMNGTEGPRAQSTRAFARNLGRLIELPIVFWDERLSTAAVNRVLIEEADASRRTRGEVVDKMAAAYILQGALDRLIVLDEAD